MKAVKAVSEAWTAPGLGAEFQNTKVFFRRHRWQAWCPECGWEIGTEPLYSDAYLKARQHAHHGCPARAQSRGRNICGLCQGVGTTVSGWGVETCRHCDGKGSFPRLVS